MRYEDMSDFEIDVEVARITDFDWHKENGVVFKDNSLGETMVFDPCNNPSDAWPIIVENKITIDPEGSAWQFDESSANWHYEDGVFNSVLCHNKPLRAAMICFLRMKDRG